MSILRFGSIQDAREYCRGFFQWYNREHYHSGLNYFTPYSVHYGQADVIMNQRQQSMDGAFKKCPERFRNGAPKISGAPTKVWINKPEDD